jgi:hypothetical protein
MMAKLISRQPVTPLVVAPISDDVPWGTPFRPGDRFPLPALLPAGSYTLAGHTSGSADVTITTNAARTAVTSVAVSYTRYGNDGIHIINGTERCELVGTNVTWHESLRLSGRETGTKLTSEPAGFTLSVALSALASPDFEPTGTLTTTVDGQTYTQPRNGT